MASDGWPHSATDVEDNPTVSNLNFYRDLGDNNDY